MTPLGSYVVETIVMLLGVLGLAILVLFTTRRFGVGRPHGPISLVGRLMLDARRAVYLVKVGETFYVLGSSEAGLTKLGEIDRATLGDLPQDLANQRAPQSFSQLLHRLQAKAERPNPKRPERSDGD
jgi:flagellar biogenesis protein FliO